VRFWLIFRKILTHFNPPNGVAGKHREFFYHEGIRLRWAMPASPDRLQHEEIFNRGLTQINADLFFASLVFLAKPAFKASFVAGYCLRPQGHRNGLIQKLAKKVFY
jgi:hypothetical protein